MAESIPAPILLADQVHHQILEEISFSKHLNPVNSEVARQAFMRGAAAPPFEYTPLYQADDALARLDDVEPDRAHPAGDLVGKSIDHTRLLIRALRDRAASAFHLLPITHNWYPEAKLLQMRFADPRPALPPMNVSADELIRHLETALEQRGVADWKVIRDHVMSARVLVDGAKRVLRVHPEARFRHRDIARLIAHEIDVHVLRSVNGQQQPLRCFETGLPGSLATEEGLAMVAEERTGTHGPGVLARQLEVLKAINMAREMGFHELFARSLSAWEVDWLGAFASNQARSGTPDLPGVYAKGSVYLGGQMQVVQWLDNGAPSPTFMSESQTE